MISNVIFRMVDFCRRSALAVVALSLVLTGGMGFYIAGHLKMNTDVDQLLSQDLLWKKREKELELAFPHTVSRLAIVIDGATPDLAENGASTLFKEIQARPDLFKNATRPDSIPYFAKNGLLFLSEEKVSEMTEMMIKAQPLMGALASDPSLRGLFKTLDMVALGLKEKAFDPTQVDEPFTLLADTIDAIAQGKDTLFPWRGLMTQGKPTMRDLRKFILVQPVLDYAALSPGKKASQEIRAIAAQKGLTADSGVTVRLTGSVALSDEEFASVADGAMVSTILSFVMVLGLLFLALKSPRLIAPILYTLIVGLVATTAFATYAIGSLNLISVAFAVMFLGIAVDFGIQFSVRYREERYHESDPVKAMTATAHYIGKPLFLAAVSTALGFLAFTPTDYRGVAELGLIACAGMMIAFFLNVTLLPALLSLTKPPAEKESVGYAWAAPVDTFLIKHRKACLKATLLVTIIALGISTQIRFDFDPLNLKNPNTESVSTLFDIMKDPDASPYTVQILAPSLAEAQDMASKIEKLPEVDHVLLLSSFVPSHQDEKLAVLSDANMILSASLFPSDVAPSPTDQETKEAMATLATSLASTDLASAQRLGNVLKAAAQSEDKALLERMNRNILDGAVSLLSMAKSVLSAESITTETITDDLKRDWVSPQGSAKIEVYPKGDGRDHKTLTAFTSAVRSIVPEASGAPISIQESGDTIVNAFILAGILALIVVSVLTYIMFRRIIDVVYLIAPMILAGILTLATMVIIHLPLNFANIIALPLLLSLGVSYAVYFVSFWREGHNKPLQSSMARAVLFSAATTLVAFGSLSLSAHTGTSGMGELLTIALVYCLLCTFFVLVPLLGKAQKG